MWLFTSTLKKKKETSISCVEQLDNCVCVCVCVWKVGVLERPVYLFVRIFLRM